MEQNGQRSQGHTERRILVGSYATGLWPRFATLVRGSSRRITIVKASPARSSNIRVINRRVSQLRPLSLLLQPPAPQHAGVLAGVQGPRASRAGYAALDPGCALQPSLAVKGGRRKRGPPSLFCCGVVPYQEPVAHTRNRQARGQSSRVPSLRSGPARSLLRIGATGSPEARVAGFRRFAPARLAAACPTSAAAAVGAFGLIV